MYVYVQIYIYIYIYTHVHCLFVSDAGVDTRRVVLRRVRADAAAARLREAAAGGRLDEKSRLVFSLELVFLDAPTGL